MSSIAGSLVAIKEQGLSVLLVEQTSRSALDVADRVYVIDQGVIQFGGSAADLRANDAPRRCLLTV